MFRLLRMEVDEVLPVLLEDFIWNRMCHLAYSARLAYCPLLDRFGGYFVKFARLNVRPAIICSSNIPLSPQRHIDISINAFWPGT
jgi:hypothetical protein